MAVTYITNKPILRIQYRAAQENSQNEKQGVIHFIYLKVIHEY